MVHALEPIGASVLLPAPEAAQDIAAMVSEGVPGFTPTQDSRYYFNYHHRCTGAAGGIDAVKDRASVRPASVRPAFVR